MAVTMTSIRLDTHLADEAKKVLRVKSRTEAVHVALREIVVLKRFKRLMKKNAGGALVRRPWVSGSCPFSTRRFSLMICAPAVIRRESKPSRVSFALLQLCWLSCGEALPKPAEQKFLRASARNHPVLTPTEKNWLESGQILGKIRADRGFAPDKLRHLHFDVLIALTARSQRCPPDHLRPGRLRAHQHQLQTPA